MPTSYPNAVSHLLANQYLDADKLGYVQTALYGAQISQLLPITPTAGFMKDAYFEKDFSAASGVSKRRLNERPDATSKNPYIRKEEQTQIYSAVAAMDKKLMRYNAEDFAAKYDQLLNDYGTDIFLKLDWDIVNGTIDNYGVGFNGFEARVPIGDAMDVNNSATVSLKTSTGLRTFTEMFRKTRDKIKAGPGTQLLALANETVHQSISAGRDQLGANVVGYDTMDILNQRVTTIDGVPLLKLRTDDIGTEILPFDENGESSTSVWLVAVGAPLEGSKGIPNGVCLLSSSLGLERETDETVTQVETLIEGDFGLRVPKRSLARISRLVA